MTHQSNAECGIAEVKDDSNARDAVYEATDAAIEAIEKAYVAKVSQAPVSQNKTYEVDYAAKAAAKVSIYEIASRAITSMAIGASDKKMMIAATAIATIRQIRWS
ncbi:MAG: hypothetical protein WCS52_15030 [bacterium]